MHIHGANRLQYAAMLPTQATQQTQAERRAAAVVRRRLTALSAGQGEDDAVIRLDAYAEGERNSQQERPPDEEAFRNILVSFNA